MLLIFKYELALDFFCFIEIVSFSFSYRMELTKGLLKKGITNFKAGLGINGIY